MADDDMSLGIETDYSRLLECIDGFRALLLPLVEAQEAKKAENPPVVVPQDAQQGATLPDGKYRETKQSKRTRTGLSALPYDKEAFELFKEKKRKEIHEFQMSYQGPSYDPVERLLWGEICRDYDCPMGNEAFNHEIGKECEKDPMEAWISGPADIILTDDAAKVYREAEAALAEAKEKNPNWSMDKDWICDNQSCPNLYRHARGEACKLKMEDMLPLPAMPKDPANAKWVKCALNRGWKYSGMRPYTGMYCINRSTKK
jgi:hypothetical protein